MDFIDTLNISGSGLAAQRVRLQTISSNMANARTTQTEEGGPYKRKAPVFQAEAIDSFGNALESALATVEVTEIKESEGGVQLEYDPSHPHAGPDGYVAYPDISILHEMVDLMTTSRSYEANANVVDTTLEMASLALEIGR